jgi:Ca2+-binding RTX toxin-like protein
MAIIRVPTDQATLVLAVAAASPGDTIQVEDSYTGAESGVTIDKTGLTFDVSANVNPYILDTASGLGGDISITTTGSAAFTIRGRGGDDTLVGNDGNNILRGRGGNDTLNGGGQSSTFGDVADYAGSGGPVQVTLTDGVGGGPTGGFSTGAAGNDTLIDIESIRGSDFDDTITGNSSSNLLRGNQGADTIDGGAGNDWADYSAAGGSVTVTLIDDMGSGHTGGLSSGADGIDILIDIEFLRGGDFNDTLTGNSGRNYLRGGGGNDTLDGKGGRDTADYFGAPGSVTVTLTDGAGNGNTGGFSSGAQGNDSLINIENIRGSSFSDTLIGNSGINFLTGMGGGDVLNGRGGFDFASYGFSSTGLTVNLGNSLLNTGEAIGDTYISIEGIVGSDFDDILTGDDNDNRIDGQDGGDEINGGGGIDYARYKSSDVGVTVSLATPGTSNTGIAIGDTYTSIEGLQGSDFDDTLIGDGNNNWFIGGNGADDLQGGGGHDIASYRTGDIEQGVTASLANSLDNTSEAAGDSYTSIEGLEGSYLDDILIGDGNANTLLGFRGNDMLMGNAGADAMDGGDGADTASYAGSGAVDVRLFLNRGWNNDAQGDTLHNIENLIGTDNADILFGDANDNIIRGGAGADIMNGFGNSDTLSYEDSAAGVDVRLTSGSGYGGDAENDIFGNFENIIGTAQADILFGDGNDNTIHGGASADIMNGFGGNDTVSYAGATGSVDVRLALGTGYSGDSAGDVIAQFENIIGGNNADILFGDGNANIIRGGAGADIMNAFGGIDTVSYEGSGSGVDVRLALGRGYSGDAAGDIVAGFENIIGSSFADILFGNALANTIRGGAGADIMNGFDGNDVFEFYTADFRSDVRDIIGTFEEAAGNTDILRLQGTAGDYTFADFSTTVKVTHNATGGEILLGNFTVAQLDAAQVDYFM